MDQQNDDPEGHHPYEDPLSSTNPSNSHPTPTYEPSRGLERAVRFENRHRNRMMTDWEETPADRISMKLWSYTSGAAAASYLAAKTYEHAGVDLLAISSLIMPYLSR